MSESEYDSSDSPTYLGGNSRQEPEEEEESGNEGNHGALEQEDSADSESEDESDEESDVEEGGGENVEAGSGEESGQEGDVEEEEERGENVERGSRDGSEEEGGIEEERGENVEASSRDESEEEGDVEEGRSENVGAGSGEELGEEEEDMEEEGGGGNLEAGSGEEEVSKSIEADGEDGDLGDEGKDEAFGEEVGGESESSGKEEEEGEREEVQETEKWGGEGSVGVRAEESEEEGERDKTPMDPETSEPVPVHALTSGEGEGRDSPADENIVGDTVSSGEPSDGEDSKITDAVALANRQVDEFMRDSEEEGLELPMAGVTATVEEPQRSGEEGEGEREEQEEGGEPGEEEDKEGEQRTGAMDDVFELSEDEEMSSMLKRKRQIEKEEEEEEGPDSPAAKRRRASGDSEEEEEGADEEGHVKKIAGGEGGEGLVVGGERTVREETGVEEDEGSDDELEDDEKLNTGISDWDLMMARRKEAMARARKRRRRRDGDLTLNDDHIVTLIREMKKAAEEDCQLNLARKAATKKLQMLPTVISHLKKADLQTTFLECGILAALAVWLSPLPDHSLPHLKIREAILDILKIYPVPDSSLLKTSKIGKAVMLLYRHPKETRKNREKAGKLVNEWARPIFGLASDFKSLSREERKELDRRQAAQRRLSSGSESKKSTQDEEFEPQKPGDKGWIGRARVPMPSTKDYVARPKWNVEHEFRKRSSKKTLNRYEKQLQKRKQQKQQMKATHAIPISIEGRRMPL